MTPSSNWDLHWKNMQKIRQIYEYIQTQQFNSYTRLIESRLTPESKILEIGCGSGYLARQLCSNYQCEALLVDNSAEAKQFFLQHNTNPKIWFKQADAFKLRIPPEFDLVYSDGLIEHFVGKKQKELMKIHAKATKPDGAIVFFVPYRSKRYQLLKKFQEVLGLWNYGFEEPYSKNDFEQLLEENDFSIEKITRSFWEIGALCTKK